MKTLKAIAAVFFCACALFAQSPQTSDVSHSEHIVSQNSKWVNGIAPGYWATCTNGGVTSVCSGLILYLSPGTALDATATIVTYAGGTLSMTDNSTNYIYLDSAASFAPASNTTGFSCSNPQIAKVTTASGIITAIVDVRLTRVGCNASSGMKVNGVKIAGTNGNFNDATPAAGTNYANVKWQKDTSTPDTNISAEIPAALDTALGLIKSATCASHNWISSITSGTGAIGCSQPSFADISGTATTSQLPGSGSTTVNGATCTLGSSCTVSGRTVTYTSNQTASTSDNGKLVNMNCSSACSYTLPNPQPSSAFYVRVMTSGSTVATIALGTSMTFNGSASVPVLNSYRPVPIYADSGTSTNYLAEAPLKADTNIIFTATPNALKIAASTSGSGCSSSSSHVSLFDSQGTIASVGPTGTTASYGSAVTCGNWMFAEQMSASSTVDPPVVTDALGACGNPSHQFTLLGKESAQPNNLWLYACQATSSVAAGDTVSSTVACSSCGIIIWQMTGLRTLDTATQIYTSGTTPTLPITLNSTNEVVISAIAASHNAAVMTANSPLTQFFQQGGFDAMAAGWAQVASPGIVNTSWACCGAFSGTNDIPMVSAAFTTGAPASQAVFYQQVKQDANPLLTQRHITHFISGINTTVGCVDNSGADSTDCTFSSAGGGGGGTPDGYDLFDGSSYYLFPPKFTVTPVTTSTFTGWLNQGTSTETAFGTKAVELAIPAGSPGAAVRTQNIGTSTTAILAFVPILRGGGGSGVNPGVGVCLYETSSQHMLSYTWSFNNGPIGYNVWFWTAPTVFNSVLTSVSAGIANNFPASYILLRVQFSGANIVFSDSQDGGNVWITDRTEAKTAHFTTGPDKWGYCGYATSSTTQWDAIASWQTF